MDGPDLAPARVPAAAAPGPVAERLFALQAFPPRLLRMAPDGTDRRTLVRSIRGVPDGLTVDRARGHLYWTSMGRRFDRPDGFVERADLDGGNRRIVVPPGATTTPKQIQYVPETDRLYWSDREGMRVMSARPDGGDLRTLVQVGQGAAERRDATRHCVGIAVDPGSRRLFWTQKGPPDGNRGRILAAPLDLPPGADPAARTDVATLAGDLPEPIDLLLLDEGRTLLWTDRGRGPRGNTLNRAAIAGDRLADHAILLRGLREGIGVCAARDGTLFVSDLVFGHIRRLDPDPGARPRVIRRGWPLTGLVCA